MYTISNTNEFDLYSLLLNKIVSSPALEGKVARELFVVTSLKLGENKSNCIDINLSKQQVSYNGEYKKLFPEVSPDLISLELSYWTDELFGSNRISSLVDSMCQDIDSKRHVIALWDNVKHMDSNNIAPSTIYLYFRLKDDVLNLHVHARTSNAFFLTFMDTQIFCALLHSVSQKIGKRTGTLSQVYDSLLIFEKQLDNARKQINFINNSTVWKKYD